MAGLTDQEKTDINNSFRYILFEFNDSVTRDEVRTKVDTILKDGNHDEYLIVCDETNNSDEAINRGEFKLDVFTKNKDDVNFTQTTFSVTTETEIYDPKTGMSEPI